MSKKNKAPWAPRDYIVGGLVAAVVGGFLAGVVGANGNGDSGMLLFALVGGAAGIVVLIGIIGQGVAIGMREHRRERLFEKLQDHA